VSAAAFRANDIRRSMPDRSEATRNEHVSDIFISYANEDLERVRPLGRAFEELGRWVFRDRVILPGQRWDRIIRSGGRRAGRRCDAGHPG
jgi:hypothetical protein